MIYDTQRPYALSGVIVQDKSGRVAFILRSNTNWMNNHYGLPSGKTEKGESFVAGAIREAKEEIGITIEPEDLEHAITVHRASSSIDTPGESMEWVDVYFTVKKYIGEAYNAEPDVHSELVWLNPNDLPENVIPSVAATMKAWASGENYLEYSYDQPRE